MLSQKLEDALNGQSNAEFYSSYLYLSMSAYFQSRNLNGFAHWMRIQAQEELQHALKFYDYVHERGGTVTLTTVEQPPSTWESPLAAFENAYQHEQHVTSLINELYSLAEAERDRATMIFLDWFISEQVEEEASASDVVEKIKLIGDDTGSGLYMLDRELGERGPLTESSEAD
ncbi:MAG: ferritin [Deltaproteobacteria bacterium]|nr:MAG: ferritin [Deltaproteobacteria bacterium]